MATDPIRDAAGPPSAIRTFDIRDWTEPDDAGMRASAVDDLESGKILFFPDLQFRLEESEQRLLTPAVADPKTKNVSFDSRTGAIKGVLAAGDIDPVRGMMKRYWERTRTLVENLSPGYASALETGRTSFRPSEIEARSSSIRKDDKRLHIDAFVSSPMGGRRILRVFTNVNRETGRHWQIGPSFASVSHDFLRKLPRQMPGSAWFLEMIGATHGRRTPYDHLMLQLHDAMKFDTAYQQRAERVDFVFPAGSTWITFTDMVPHAALSGQYLLEQTFYLPVAAMADESKSPLRVLEREAQRPLV